MENSIIVTIKYCSKCKWLLRATWMAQELLQTFENNITSINLTPYTNGTYQIFINKTLIWDKKLDGGFPEPSIIKIKLRDHCLPDHNLNHTKKINNIYD